MRKLLLLLTPVFIILLLPEIAHATTNVGSALDFTPPTQDVSVIFLSNIFGIVDGVLHGTGSQIIGQMFGVFNSAVLALGGIVLMYTLLVSTMNTAHEGEMLGKKWSSIWIPIRSTVGLGLLLPKATGYCMMQIFVMWIVVQGVGAADKVWDAALGYLNRGGVIIQANMDPNASKNSANGAVAQAAADILVAQVCMLGIEKRLSEIRASFTASKGRQGTKCYNPTGKWKKFCKREVPDFLASADLSGAVAKSNKYTVSMPSFSESTYPLYSQLNGICGSITWAALNEEQLKAVKSLSGDNTSDTDANTKARSIAMQQVYNDTSQVASLLIDNDPGINTGIDCNDENTNCVSKIGSTDEFYYAKSALGYPLTTNSKHCTAGIPVTSGEGASPKGSWASGDPGNWNKEGEAYKKQFEEATHSKNISNAACASWGTVSGGGALLSGSELQGAVSDYNGIMMPTLKQLKTQAAGQGAQYQQARAFINTAKAQGWLMAGAYFFNLAKLNTWDPDVAEGSNATNSGLSSGPGISVTGKGGGTFSVSALGKLLSPGSKCAATFFCSISGDSETPWYIPISTLLNGTTPKEAPSGHDSVPDVKGQPKLVYPNEGTFPYPNTVYGFVINAFALQLPGQAGMKAPTFIMKFNFDASTPVNQLPYASFSGGFMGIPGNVATLIYNGVARQIFNTLLQVVMPIVNDLFFLLVSPPILLLAGVFSSAVKQIQNPAINPIIALANMGSAYINGVASMWIQMAAATAGAASIGTAALGLLAIVAPVIMSWMGVMVAIGINCAYYVPLVPYIIFTFGAFAWVIGVIEAMVAAPIVALGVTHPEGHEAFGKGEQAIMLILGVFLRPSMMILGYMFGIILSYVGIWLINAGFGMAIEGVQGIGSTQSGMGTEWYAKYNQAESTAYNQWTGLFFYFFSIVIYTTMYVSVVQKSFSLIHILPDKVLRWLSGGQAESFGSEIVAGMTGEAKEGAQKAGGAVESSLQQLNKADDKKGGKGGGGGGKAGGQGAAEATGK